MSIGNVLKNGSGGARDCYAWELKAFPPVLPVGFELVDRELASAQSPRDFLDGTMVYEPAPIIR